MREAGTLLSQAEARRLSDYLLTVGIETEVAERTDGFVLWVYDDHALARAKAELERFRQSPDAPQYAASISAAAAMRKQASRADANARANFIDVRARWIHGVQGKRPLTLGLIAVSVVVGLATKLGDWPEPVLDKLTIASYVTSGGYIEWAGLSDILSRGQLWRLVTPIFIHFSLLHILFNMFWLRDLGSLIEVRKGSWYFLLFVLASAAGSNLTQYFIGGPSFGGMSGVDYALFGYVWMKGRYEPACGMALQPNTVAMMLGWLVLGMAGILGPIANGAHGAGLVVGCAIGAAPHFWRRVKRSRL